MTDSEEKQGVKWADFTGDLFSVNTTDWGTIQESICGDQSQVIQEPLNNNVTADPENQYGLSHNSTHPNNAAPNQNDAGNNPYLPNTQNCDESDYGEVVVNDDAHDAISTVTPATFAQRRMPRILAYNQSAPSNAPSNASSVDELKSI
jgi:hypothetical protein